MDKTHKNILLRNRVYIVENLDTSSLFLSYLISDSILTSQNEEEIHSQSTSHKKASFFLDILIRRGPRAYYSFLKALICTDQKFIAEYLDKLTTYQLNKQISSEDDNGFHDENMSQSFTQLSSSDDASSSVVEKRYGVHTSMSVSEMFNNASKETGDLSYDAARKDDPIKAIIKKEILNGQAVFDYLIDYSNVIQLSEDLDPYPLGDYRVRGVVYILNVMTYTDNRNERLGSDIDVKNVRNLFEKMGYKVELVKEKKKMDIRTKMAQISNDDELNDAGLFAMFLMSHGRDRIFIQDEDHELMNINEEFVKPFMGNRCPQLASKPKLFFVQACRGDNVYFDHANQKIEDTIIERKTDEGASHPSSHIFMFFSTPEEYKSARTPKGSIFIRCLVLTISHFCHRYNIDQIAKIVNNVMDSLSIECRKGEKGNLRQVSTVERNSLTKDVYFFPVRLHAQQ